MRTEKQQKAIKLVKEKIKRNETINMGQIMVQSGYSPAVARNPKVLTESKTWEETMKSIDFGNHLRQVSDLADTRLNKDKDNALKAKDMLFKLGNKYPDKITTAVSLFQKIEKISE
jgi:hypothetical protein